MPPKPGPPPRQVPRRRIRRRRLAAAAGVVVVLAVVFGLVELARGRKSSGGPTTSALVFPKPFKIVFPEGFSRRDMAHRVQVVARIAQSKHRGHVRLSQRGHDVGAARPEAAVRVRRQLEPGRPEVRALEASDGV